MDTEMMSKLIFGRHDFLDDLSYIATLWYAGWVFDRDSPEAQRMEQMVEDGIIHGEAPFGPGPAWERWFNTELLNVRCAMPSWLRHLPYK